MKKTLMVAVSALTLLLSTQARGEFKKCVGPNGDVRYVNTECPDGYRVEGSMPATDSSSRGSEEEPYICRFASIITAGEIESALADAQGSLQESRTKGDGEAERYWAQCLADLRQRNDRLQTLGEEPLEEAPAACTEGEFEYKEDAIFFTSSRRGACQGLRALCTFDVRRTQRVVRRDRDIIGDRIRGDEYTTSTAQETREFNYSGKISKFGSARIGDVGITGRVTSWNCRSLD